MATPAVTPTKANTSKADDVLLTRGSLMSRAIKRSCTNCGEEVLGSQSCPWGKSAWCCHPCKTNYNRQMERLKGNAPLRNWWKGMSKEQKKQWFVRNKATYEPNGRKAFDTAGIYEELQENKNTDADDTLYDFLTLEDWVIREKLPGRCGSGAPAEQFNIGKRTFEAKVLDKKDRCKWAEGQWLVGVFKGVRERVSLERTRTQAHKRQRTINDTVDHEVAQELSAECSESMASHMHEIKRARTTGIDMSAGASIDIDQDMAMNPVVAEPDGNEFLRDIKWDVLAGVQRACVMQAQEEVDEHEAAQVSKVARAAFGRLGRPPKLESELKADISKCIRDRATHVKDSSDGLRRARDEVEKEAKRQLTTLPQDVASVLGSMKADVETACQAMDEIGKTLKQASIDEYVQNPEGGVRPKLDDIKKLTFEKSKPAFSTHLVNGNKAIGAFKTSVKKALKQSNNKGKKGAAVGQKPPMATKLLELAEESAEDICNVRVAQALDGENVDVASFMEVAPLKAGLEKAKGLPNTTRWLHKEIDKNKDNLTYAMAAHKPATAKEVMAILRQHVGSFMVGDIRLPAEHDMLKEDIFGAQAWAQSETHLNAGVTPYGLPEARVLTSGGYIVAGVSTNKVRGDTLKAKLEHRLKDKGFREFLASAGKADEGFWALHDKPHSCLIVPAGHVIVTCGLHSDDKDAKGANGLRWSFLQVQRPAALQAAKDRLAQIISAYPELNTDEYSDWMACLERYLLPAALAQR